MAEGAYLIYQTIGEVYIVEHSVVLTLSEPFIVFSYFIIMLIGIKRCKLEVIAETNPLAYHYKLLIRYELEPTGGTVQVFVLPPGAHRATAVVLNMN